MCSWSRPRNDVRICVIIQSVEFLMHLHENIGFEESSMIVIHHLLSFQLIPL